MQTLELSLFADYFQFYIQDDDDGFGDLSEAWSPEAEANLMALGDHVVGIGTVRNLEVPVHIQVSDELPDLGPSDWDRLNRCTIQCDTGRFVVAGCTDYFPDAERIEVAPGEYDVIIAYRGLGKVSQDGLDGEDSYHLFLAPKK